MFSNVWSKTVCSLTLSFANGCGVSPSLAGGSSCWLLEQQDTEREIQADDDITRREMKTKIAELRRRPVGPLSDLEQTVIREALASDDGRVAPGTNWRAQTALLDIYFKPTGTAAKNE